MHDDLIERLRSPGPIARKDVTLVTSLLVSYRRIVLKQNADITKLRAECSELKQQLQKQVEKVVELSGRKKTS